MTGVLAPDAVTEPCIRAAPLHADRELEAVASMLRLRFPDFSSEDIDHLVTREYTQLAQQSRVHAHLIPLTLNRCRRVLTVLTSSMSTLDDDRSR